MSTKTAEETLADFRKKNSDRQMRHYLAHKDAINQKRRDVYKAGVLATKTATIVNQPVENITPSLTSTPTPVMATTSQYGNNVVDYSKQKSITQEQVNTALEIIVKSPASLKKYKDDLKMFVRITECTDILKCLKNPTKMISQIKNAKQRNGNPYAINSIKGVYQLIPFLITHLQLSLPIKTKNAYKKEFSLSKMQSDDYTKEVAETKETMTFKDYLQKVKETLGEKSKLYAIAKFYDEFTLRDNFGLIVVEKLPKQLDNKNYLVKSKNDMKISINEYKTIGSYGAINATLSKGLEKIVRLYMTENNVKLGSYLFGTEKLTQFVSLTNKQIGLSGGVGEYRHMKITDILAGEKKLSNEKKLELSNKMKHSPIVQLKYLRTNIV